MNSGRGIANLISWLVSSKIDIIVSTGLTS